MDSPAQTDPTPEPQVVFRGKKRKLFRRRPTEEEYESSHIAQPAIAADIEESRTLSPDDAAPPAEVEEEVTMAEILRRRHTRKPRLHGVGFGLDEHHDEAADREEVDLDQMIRQEEQRARGVVAGGMTKRFAAQTGLAGELVNKHMEEFIEAELAKRHSAAATIHSGSPATQHLSSSGQGSSAIKHSNQPQKPEGHAVLQGRLNEIDLGDEVRDKNVAMTDRARRKLEGGEVEDDHSDARPKKVRLGRDGKPWRPRKRRGSDDVKRDQLVEEILRENRLDMYDTPTPPATNTAVAVDDDGAADDRIAEEFRREFMDAMAQRQQKKKPAGPPGKPGAKDEDVLKGPKLGGSRSARAAMRDLLLKKEKEGKR